MINTDTKSKHNVDATTITSTSVDALANHDDIDNADAHSNAHAITRTNTDTHTTTHTTTNHKTNTETNTTTRFFTSLGATLAAELCRGKQYARTRPENGVQPHNVSRESEPHVQSNVTRSPNVWARFGPFALLCNLFPRRPHHGVASEG